MYLAALFYRNLIFMLELVYNNTIVIVKLFFCLVMVKKLKAKLVSAEYFFREKMINSYKEVSLVAI